MEIKAETITNDLEYLKQVSEDVDLNDPKLKDYILTLKEYFSTKSALAMAAIQLGIPKRLIYIRNTNLKDLENKEKDEATVLSHEYDHLDGILHFDRAVQVYELSQDKRKEFRKLLPNDGYEIISEEGFFEYDSI